MSNIETYYLIDYENVGGDGLSGCENLSKSDHILIFFTQNAQKINMSGIANHGSADLDMIEIPAGKQSVDIHIGSYLGFLSGKDCNVVIVSKDTDFDNVIKFWKAKTGVTASRTQKIKAVAPQASTAKKEPIKKTPKVTPENKAKLNMAVQKALSAEKYDNKTIGEVASMVVAHYGENHLLVTVHNELHGRFNNYLDIYSTIKSVVAKYDSSPDTTPDRSEVNKEMQQLLSKAGMESEVINYVASLVVKNIGVKNRKQQIYRSIISKYGQGKGLSIYYVIKKHILST